MGVGSMGVMSSKFGSGISAYSYLIFVLLYVPCVSVMGAIARESSRGWMTFSILWGLNVAYCWRHCSTVATFNQHPQYSLTAIPVVLAVNLLVLFGLRGRAAALRCAGNATPAACCRGAKGAVTDGRAAAGARCTGAAWQRSARSSSANRWRRRCRWCRRCWTVWRRWEK